MLGESFGSYEITGHLGKGGMGDVYRARDTSLDRDVAIKVLPPEFSTDAERLARFEREAKLLASLNHPNIASIYGLERHGDRQCLVLELVGGENLAERLQRGPIPVEEALALALQIAEGMEAAHERGVIHRDLKPSNVMIDPEGRAKLLDFGLAKALDPAPEEARPSAALSASPTLTSPMTQAGMILGTAAYMSPEQARGKPADRRSDIWAFGVVVWEMLTGRSLFAGDTIADVIAAVVTREPDLDTLPTGTPREVRRLLARCLRKDQRTRLPQIGAARLELQDVLAGTTPEVEAPAIDSDETARADRERRARRRRFWGIVTLVAGGVIAGLIIDRLTDEPQPPLPARFAVAAPEGWVYPNYGWPVPSPDGSQIVFRASAADQDSEMLWIRPLESLTARPLVGTEGIHDGMPFWSPDGRFLAFFADGELRRLSLADGTVQKLCALPSPGGIVAGDWNHEGTILFSAAGPSSQIFSVPSTGGEAVPFLQHDSSRQELWHIEPQFLPDGNRFLFHLGSGQEERTGLYLASRDNPDERQQIATGVVRRVYAAGHLFFVNDGILFAQPFDVDRAELGGEPIAIASSVAFWNQFPGWGWFGVSPQSTLAYLSGEGGIEDVQLAWLDRQGQQIETVGAAGNYGQIALSPDERNVALELRDAGGHYDLWVMDLARGVTSRVTTSPGDERDPVWSPDSRSLAYSTRSSDGADLRRKGLRASEPETVLTDSIDEDIPESWSQDGERLLLVRRSVDDEQSIWALSIAGDGEAEPVLNTGFRVDEPHLSPDGRWLAYVSSESGSDEVYLESFSRQQGERIRVSAEGGGQPKWGRDGQELFFVTPEGLLHVVSVRAEGDRLEVSLPTELFEIHGLQGTDYDDYAVSADGQRFLVKLPTGAEKPLGLAVVTNWMSLLE